MASKPIPAGTVFCATTEVGGRSFELRWASRSDVPPGSVANVWGDLVARLLAERPDARSIRLTRDGD